MPTQKGLERVRAIQASQHGRELAQRLNRQTLATHLDPVLLRSIKHVRDLISYHADPDAPWYNDVLEKINQAADLIEFPPKNMNVK